MIPLIPLTIYYIIQKVKEKEIFSFDIIILTFLILYMAILFIGLKLELVSTYFLMKNYFALWTILIYLNYKSLIKISEKSKALPYMIIGIYIFVIAINLIFIKMPINHDNINEGITNIAEIFGVNKTVILNRKEDLTSKEIEVLEYAKQNLNFEENDIEILGEDEQIYWTYSLLRYINYEEAVETLRQRLRRTGKTICKIYGRPKQNRKSRLYNIFQKSRILYKNKRKII